MARLTCPGLPGDWINGWLAAVGATVLDSRIRLQWTPGTPPLALLSAKDADPIALIADSWPDTETLEDLPISEHWRGAGSLCRKVPLPAFVKRARASRSHPASWALSSTMTDLHIDQNGEVAHAPFDPSGPGTIKWMHHRLVKVHRQVKADVEHIHDSFAGKAIRVVDNGLGFDLTRIGSLADGTKPRIDPVLEFLVFFGLSILPLRGRGSDRRANPSSRNRETQRGWLRPSDNKALQFHWPAWNQPLDSTGIDALMDVWIPNRKRQWPLIGVHAGWRTVRYESRGSSDTTRGFGSQSL